MMKKIIYLFFCAIMVFMACGKPQNKTAINDSKPKADPSLLPSNNSKKKIKMVEYSDFQCGGCKAYSPYVKAIIAEYNDVMEFEYRHFPLNYHKNAMPAAIASEAARRQNKFQAMHDLLFEKQDEWNRSNRPLDLFKGYAKQIKLNEGKFIQDMRDPEIRKKIDRQKQRGLLLGITGTPSIYVNGQLLPREIDQWRSIIQEMLNNM